MPFDLETIDVCNMDGTFLERSWLQRCQKLYVAAPEWKWQMPLTTVLTSLY